MPISERRSQKHQGQVRLVRYSRKEMNCGDAKHFPAACDANACHQKCSPLQRGGAFVFAPEGKPVHMHVLTETVTCCFWERGERKGGRSSATQNG